MRARSLATLRLLAAAAAAPASHDLLADAGIDLLPPAALQPRPAGGGADRILGLTSTFCRPSPTNARLAETLRLACARYPTLRVALNVFDADGADACFDADNATAALPSCIVGRHRVRGHKAVFWREVATPARVSAYDIVFAFDNDMRIADDDFDLLEAARLLRRSGAGMGQPRVALTERAAVAAGLARYSLAGALLAERNASAVVTAAAAATSLLAPYRTGIDAVGHLPGPELDALTGAQPMRGCQAYAMQYVENQAPLFLRGAWVAVHTQLLSKLPTELITTSNFGISNVWCDLVARRRETSHPGCALLHPVLTTSDEKTIDLLGLTNHTRAGSTASEAVKAFAKATWPQSYVEGPAAYARGACLVAAAPAAGPTLLLSTAPSAGLYLDFERLNRTVNLPAYALARDALLAEAVRSAEADVETVVVDDDFSRKSGRNLYFSGRYYDPEPAGAKFTPDAQHIDPAAQLGGENAVRRTRAQHLFDNVTVLTLAGVASGNRTLLDRAAAWARAWFVEPATAMRPTLAFAQMPPPGQDGKMGTGIIEWRYVYYVTDALAQLEREGALPAAEAAKSRAWFSELLGDLNASAYAARERGRSNNHGLWLDVTTLAIAHYTADAAAVRRAATSIAAARLDEQLDARGLLAQEIARGDHCHHYVLFTCHAWLVAARMLARLEPAEAPDGSAAAVDAARRRICEMAARHVDAADGQCPGVAMLPSEVARRDQLRAGRMAVCEGKTDAELDAALGAARPAFEYNTSIAPFWQLASNV